VLEAFTATAVSSLDLPKIVLAIGSLGTAAYGFVDVSKGFWGGVSNRGFGDIKKMVSKFISSESPSGLGLYSVLATLRANWLNGMPSADQKSVAKALIKLNLTDATAETMANATGVNVDLLKSIANKLVSGKDLNQAETDAYGRFDLLLSAMLDQGYQRGDQRYRNSAKLLAVPVALALALLGAWAIGGQNLTFADAWRACIAGLLSTPLAPIAKDLSSAIQAGAKVAQTWK
jgi:hypothetical protein